MIKSWEKVLETVAGRVSPLSYESWFKPIKCLSITDSLCRIELPSRFFKDWFEENCFKILQESLAAVTGRNDMGIELVTPDPGQKKSAGKEKDKRQLSLADAPETSRGALFNPRYTFETFVVGAGNQFAHAACLAVSKSATPVYNPLFIYGGTGLGKTHLLHAVGHLALGNHQPGKICYITAEQFISDMISSLQHKTMSQFKNKYRKLDYLLIDDIQFIAGKERIMEEFFHTFNALYDSHKQIVISSDKIPKDIPGLEERLRSRFECGLLADIQPPDLETKVAILRRKAEESGIVLPDDVAFFIAESVRSNIRELEGLLSRVGFYESLHGKGITLELARTILGVTIDSRPKTVTVDSIKQEVAADFGIKLNDLRSKRRIKSIVLPRHVAIYITRKVTDLSLSFIGQEFGGKDHTTVINSIRKAEKIMAEDPAMQARVESIIRRIS
jgi:chromosomal replication initiator protein